MRQGTVYLLCFLLFASVWAGRAAVISGFSPASGPPGTRVIIQGSSFTTVTQVRFDTVLADFEILSTGQIACTVPMDAKSGPIRLAKGNDLFSSAASFAAVPRIADFTPARGIAGERVTVRGTNFVAGGTTVHFNQTQAAVVSVVSSTQLYADVPSGATNGPIRVTTAGGAETSAASFTVSNAPLITGFSPKAAPIGSAVLIDGANFFPGAVVRFNGVASTSVSVTQTTQLTATVPNGATNGVITVTTAAGTATSAESFITGPQPILTSFSPEMAAPGATVTLNGYNFMSGAIVRFAGVQAGATLTTLNATRIQAVIPAGATNGPITVSTSAGTGASQQSIVISAAPVVTGFTPAQGAPGQSVIITGINMSTATAVRFNEVNAQILSKGATQVQAVVPAGATNGPIKVVSPSGTGVSSTNFTVIANAPFISGFTPGQGPRGTRVSISGANFGTGATVAFNGVPADNVFVATESQILADVPAAATTGSITVTRAQATGTSAAPFHVPPRITEFSPQSAIAGAQLEVSGKNLGAVMLLEVNGVPVSPVVVSNTLLRFIVPTNATTGPLRVTTPAGIFISTNQFTILPKIYSFTPNLGPVGTAVTIEGTSLLNVTHVQFAGVNASFKVVSSERLHASVPAEAVSGRIRVTTPDGTDLSTNAFTVTVPSDLAISKTGTPRALRPGETVTYTLLATNLGPSIVTGAVISDPMPAGLLALTAVSDRGACVISNNVVTCDLGIFRIAHTAEVTITATVLERAVITNTATISAIEGDPAPANNSASAITRGYADADTLLSITRRGTNLVELSWPVSPLLLSLESSESLAPLIAWNPATNSPVVISNRNVVTNSILPGRRYYRLRHP